MTKWVGLIAAAGIAISAGTVSAQGIYPRGGYGMASDLDGAYLDRPDADRPYADVPPYAGLPPEGPRPLPPRVYGPRYGERDYEPGYVPAMMPPTAVYGILRDRGYSPLGILQQRGLVYTISVISPKGDDGRLVIDARNGRILRFLPAFRMGDRMNNEISVSYGPVGAPPIATAVGASQPPASVPRVASRTQGVPLPKPAPKAAAVRASKPADAQASIQKPVADTAIPAAPPAVIEAKPSAPAVQPTQEMPAAQGLE